MKKEGNLVSHRYVSGPARDFCRSRPDFFNEKPVVAGTKVNSYYLKDHEPGGLQIGDHKLFQPQQRFWRLPFN
jgi:hypothetical protein